MKRFWKKESWTDTELVEGCMRNDRRAQEALYRRFYSKMMGMCMRHAGDKEVALEIMHNGLLKVYKKINLFGNKGSLEGWVRRIVFHSIADYYRRSKEKPSILPIDLAFSVGERPTATDRLYLEDLLDYIDELPASTRKVFQLYAIEGYKHEEIADLLGISSGTSKWHLSQARKLLQVMLKDRQYRDLDVG